MWLKKEIIYKAPMDGSWRDNSALTPTPFLLNDYVIRVYASFRDRDGIGRIGYVDVDAENPSKILKISDIPVLDIGKNGMFDDNGVILGDIIKVGNEIFMYYVGFQLVKKCKFLAYSGLAISKDNGETFKRYKNTPIMDRAEEGKYIRAIHSVMFENEKFKVWYSVGNGWININGKDYPSYDINYTESKDGINFESNGIKCLECNKENKEYRIGRPRVYKINDKYIMYFTYGTLDGKYMAGQATSQDGLIWNRDDSRIGIETSEEGWDSINIIYPSIISVGNKTYMFYNGNNMGIDGFGYAELMEK